VIGESYLLAGNAVFAKRVENDLCESPVFVGSGERLSVQFKQIAFTNVVLSLDRRAQRTRV
jgi:hypothetical protein